MPGRVRFLDQVPIGFYDVDNTGGGGLPGGPVGSIQYNDAGVLNGSANLLWNNSTNTITLVGKVNATSFVGSLFGTASWAVSASQAITASYVLNAVSASFASTASFLPVGTYNITSSWATNALTASFLPVGTYNITASWAQSASQAISSSFATTASYVAWGNIGGDINNQTDLSNYLSGYVPYSGANADVNLGTYKLLTPRIEGTAFSSNIQLGSAINIVASYNTYTLQKMSVGSDDTSAMFGVRGNSATTGTAFLVQNSTSQTMFEVFNNSTMNLHGTASFTGTMRVNNINPLVNGDIILQNTWANSTGVQIRTIADKAQVLTVTPDTTNVRTSGSSNILNILNPFAPTSGNGVVNAIGISGTINQTGGANGTIRGIYYNPTITSVLGTHNAWESTSGRIIATDTSVNPYSFTTTFSGGANSNQGAFYIVSNGNLNNLMLTSTSGTYTTTNYAGMGFMVAHSTLGQVLTVRVRSRYYDTTNATLEFYTNRGAVNPTFAGKFHGGMFAVGDFEYAAPTATLHIKGNSATTGNAFLVQNSTPTDLFKISNTGIISNSGNANIVMQVGNFALNLFSTDPNNQSSTLITTGDITRTDSGTKSIININNAIPSTAANFNTLNGFAFTSAITQTLGIVRGLYIKPSLTSATDFRGIEVVTRNNANDTLIKLNNGVQDVDVFCVKGDNKIGMYGATPTEQGTTSIASASYVHNTSTSVHVDDTFDGYTVGQVVTQLRNMGILS